MLCNKGLCSEGDFYNSVFVCNAILFHVFLHNFLHISHVADVIPLALIKGLKKLSDSCQATRHMGDYDKIQPLLKHILVKLKHCG